MKQTRTVVLILAFSLLSGPVVADQAQDFADTMLTRLAAWKIGATKTNLEAKKEQFGTTAAYKTAWGLLVASEGELDQGLEFLKQAAAADTKDPAPEIYRAAVLDWKRDLNASKSAWQSALKRAQAAVNATPEDVRANYYLGVASVGTHEYEKARTALQKALAGGFNAPMVNYQIALSYAMQQKWQLAEQSFSKVITADERFAYAYYHRGRIWDKLGRKDKMLNDLDQFVKLAPNAPDAGKAQAILNAAGR